MEAPENSTGGDTKDIQFRTFGEILQSREGEPSSITQEKFDEATYNKRLGRLRAQFGDQTINSDGVMQTIRKTQDAINESNAFLAKLYNAPESSLWYRPDQYEELYTTMQPDYRKQLRAQHQAKMREIRALDAKLESIQRKMEEVQSQLERNNGNLDERDGILRRKVRVQMDMDSAREKRREVSDELIQIDVDLVQRAMDEQDDVVSVVRRKVPFRVFKQAWNEKILNAYERDKIQYLTSKEKERYFQDKLRQLQKFDSHGILNHKDWFFRVVVLDFVSQEMQRLVLWFKNCSWDDFDTVYRITRKLKMLLLDVESIRNDDKFDVNQTNLFVVSDEDIEDYTKIDEMLEGNTLYELFNAQIGLNALPKRSSDSSSGGKSTQDEDKQLATDRQFEAQTKDLRTRRDDLVVRFWGSEANLTKEAYKIAMSNDDQQVTIHTDSGTVQKTIKEVRETIIWQKLLPNPSDEQKRNLQNYLGAFISQVRTIKEALVMEKMNEMHDLANEKIGEMDGSVNASPPPMPEV